MAERVNFLLQFESIYPLTYRHYFNVLSYSTRKYIHDLFCELRAYKARNNHRDSLPVQSLKHLLTSRRLFTLFYAASVGKLRVESCDDYEIQLICANLVRWDLRDTVFEKRWEIRGIREARARELYHDGVLQMQTDFTSFFGFLSEDLQQDISNVLTENERIARYGIAVSMTNTLYINALAILAYRRKNVRVLIDHETNVFNLFNLVELFE